MAHIQGWLPEIKAVLTAGKTPREIAEYLGFQNQQAVKGLLKRERNASWRLGFFHNPKDDREKMLHQETFGKQIAAGFSAVHRK